ncbi:MAG: type II toxin-antitoxin system HicA family toxin [Patescibacteria group bacterium]
MPKPVSWRELIRRLRFLGFMGPEWGKKHPFMVKGTLRLCIPNDHGEDIRAHLLAEILRQAEIDSNTWDEAA